MRRKKRDGQAASEPRAVEFKSKESQGMTRMRFSAAKTQRSGDGSRNAKRKVTSRLLGRAHRMKPCFNYSRINENKKHMVSHNESTARQIGRCLQITNTMCQYAHGEMCKTCERMHGWKRDSEGFFKLHKGSFFAV